MERIRYVYWQEEEETWMGYLEEYPEYMTQGSSLDDLKEHLEDLFKDLSSDSIPHIRRIAELEVS